ncbi:MAG: Asp23/Gls24 family envelope stress response protein, partial [Defluviitaleaceae bacterium]|nr:Asp23/Gls24 family envelope stress response protein [Defluviitaleaceae bacterium]
AIEDGYARIDADININYGAKVHVVCSDVQKRIKSAVETMTGLSISEINVNVSGMAHEKIKTIS